MVISLARLANVSHSPHFRICSPTESATHRLPLSVARELRGGKKVTKQSGMRALSVHNGISHQERNAKTALRAIRSNA